MCTHIKTNVKEQYMVQELANSFPLNIKIYYSFIFNVKTHKEKSYGNIGN